VKVRDEMGVGETAKLQSGETAIRGSARSPILLFSTSPLSKAKAALQQ
jgi:hypothetical protein